MIRDLHLRISNGSLYRWLTEGATRESRTVQAHIIHLLTETMDQRHQYTPSANPDDRGDCAICGNSIGAHMPMSVELQRAASAVRGVTAAELADALGCFWNAAIGEGHRQQDSEAFAVASVMAEGIAAIQRRLEEIAHAR